MGPNSTTPDTAGAAIDNLPAVGCRGLIGDSWGPGDIGAATSRRCQLSAKQLLLQQQVCVTQWCVEPLLGGVVGLGLWLQHQGELVGCVSSQQANLDAAAVGSLPAVGL